MTRRRAIIALIALLLVATGAWWWWPRGSAALPPEIVAVLEKMPAPGGPPPTPAQFAEMRSMREKVDALPAEQRQAFDQQMRGRMEKFMETQINEYLNAPPDKKAEVLKRHVNQFEAFRKNMGPPPGGAAPGGKGPPPGGPPRGRFNPKEMLARTTPERRARFSVYMQAVQEQRRKMGLPEWGPPPPPPQGK